MKAHPLQHRIEAWPKLLSAALLVALISCSSGDRELHIHYRIPIKAPSLKGITIDVAAHTELKMPMAIEGRGRNYLADTIDTYGLYVQRLGTHQVEKVGAYDLAGLFGSAFTQRLRFLGADVVPQQRKSLLALQLNIQRFSLKLEQGQWRAEIRYTGTLTKNKTVVRQETVHGRDVRKNVLGSADANRLLGDLFTQVVNQLDLAEPLADSDGP